MAGLGNQPTGREERGGEPYESARSKVASAEKCGRVEGWRTGEAFYPASSVERCISIGNHLYSRRNWGYVCSFEKWTVIETGRKLKIGIVFSLSLVLFFWNFRFQYALTTRMTKALSNSFSIEILIQVLWFYEEIGYIAVGISDTCAGDNKFLGRLCHWKRIFAIFINRIPGWRLSKEIKAQRDRNFCNIRFFCCQNLFCR